jgi:hypothetical protein
MPEGNRAAQHGIWTGENTFELESHEIGNPTHITTRFVFDGDDVEIVRTIRPAGQTLTLKGRKG